MNNHCDPSKRHDFVFLFDAINSNPNGDPDNGNLPRIDPETQKGIVTDGCIKRKIRNWIDIVYGTEERYKIYIQSKDALNTLHERAYTALNIKATKGKQKLEEIEAAKAWMRDNFYDVRMFGAVMSTGDASCGQARGPVQITFSQSIDPIMQLNVTITRMAVTRAGEDKKQEMGQKSIVPYGLYMGHGSFNPFFASGVSEQDLKRFWEAFEGMWDMDKSSVRGEINLRGLYAFTHDGPRGNAHAHKLFSLINPVKREATKVARSFQDYYKIEIGKLPEGVNLIQLV